MSFDILDPRIDSYLKVLNAKHDDPVLLDIEERAKEHGFPIVGRLCGAFLEAIALTARAGTVFEMGSGYGYSAWWFSRAVGEGGKVYCTDGSAENRDLAETYLTRAGRSRADSRRSAQLSTCLRSGRPAIVKVPLCHE